MADASQAWHAVKPAGLAAALLAVTVLFTPMILVVVGLRIWVRVTHHCFGLEDWLMCIGVTLNLVHNGVVIWGSFTGIGTPDSKLNTAMVMEGFKAVTFWQIFYISSSMFIKISICAQLLRVTDNKRIKTFLWGLIGLTVLITLVAGIIGLVRCRPLSASWDPSTGTCMDQGILSVLTYVVSGINIVVDWSVAILPVIILWNVQMHRTLKIMANVVMGIGALASVATIIRLPYSPAYSQPSDQLYGIGNIILWTVIECSLGIIAGSMPMLRKLFKALRKDDSSYARGTDDINLVTIGQVRGKHHPIYDGDVRATVAAGEDRESDRDDESTRQIIRVTKEFEQISVIEKPRSQY
ncbi:related to integral membrane protein PTH11 [Fusarium oxysporum]|uniref:Related to integral membrane protein PTH11 n=1 Tax=Fusarium oxysporum TaxID=5507 RepID=A0A2H3SHH4_FUSOX|nr:related to integral membrane protein PTH11 [Fusarium oxysporum]